MISHRPLLAEPALREQKPVVDELPPALREKLEKLAKSKIDSVSFAEGGLSVSAAFIFRLEDGRRIFAKGAHPGDTAHGVKNLADEILAYEKTPALRTVAPPYLGVVSDGGEQGWTLGVWEYVEHDPRRASLERATASLASWQRPVPAKDALPAARQHVYISQLLSTERKWQRLRGDDIARKKFCYMFASPETGKAWFDKNIVRLCQLQGQAAQLKDEEVLLHGDLRIDNFLFGETKTFVIDWPNACRGPAVFDPVFLSANLEALGFGQAETFFDKYALDAARPVTEDLGIMLAALSGYFADQAYREVVEKMPRLRWMQRSMLLALLRHMARLGLIESPPQMAGENQ